VRELKKGFPVATSSDAAARFKVSDSVNERRIVLSSGGKETAKLLIGTSPSFRLANVRAGSGSEIYSVAVSSYEAPIRGEDWMDREVLAIPADQVASVKFSDAVTLERKDGKFALAGAQHGEKVLDAKVQTAGGAILRPAFDVVQGKGAEEVAKLGTPDFQVEVKKTDGSARTYKYKKEAAGGAYLFTASDRDYVFRVAEPSVTAFVEATLREKLIEQPKPVEQPKPAEQTPAEQMPAPQSPPAEPMSAPPTPSAPAPQASPAPETVPQPNQGAAEAPAAPAPNQGAAEAPAAPATTQGAAEAPAAPPAANPGAADATTPPANQGAQVETPPQSPPAGGG
jgi:hypothetical protein